MYQFGGAGPGGFPMLKFPGTGDLICDELFPSSSRVLDLQTDFPNLVASCSSV